MVCHSYLFTLSHRYRSAARLSSSIVTDHHIPLLSFVSRVGISFFLLAAVILTNQLGAEEDADGERHDQQDGQDGDHRDEAHVTQAAADGWCAVAMDTIAFVKIYSYII